MKRKWNTLCAGLIVISLLTACGGSGTAQQSQSQTPAQSAAAAETGQEQQASQTEAEKTGAEAAAGEQGLTASAGASSAVPETAAEGASAELISSEQAGSLEDIFANHDNYSDSLSKWNAKAEKRSRGAWTTNLTPEQEQAIIDSMNENFKQAVLAQAYERLESGNWDQWDERSPYLSALLKLDLISREKADAFLLARDLYASNLERALWAEIQEIVDRAKQEYPADFPEPEPYLYADSAEEEGAYVAEAYEEAAMASEPAMGLGMSAADSYDAPENGAKKEIAAGSDDAPEQGEVPSFNTAEYNTIRENPFQSVTASPLSTFSIDVDTAGYTKLKYDIIDGYEIEKDEVKIEELINYFNYDYSGDRVGGEPFTVSTEYTRCPWNKDHGLIRIGIRADDMQEKPATNFVLVTDVSGSMTLINKLPLALSAYADMLEGFDGNDTISLMYYASGQGVVLENVSCDDHEKICRGLADVLARAGGGTYGSLGLQTAYEMAKKSYIENGVNRVIIATDGDFNIGATSEGQLKEIVEAERKNGIYLTILGYGSENLKDNKMEVMAENGNGNYHYIGDMADAGKALVQESASTLIPMADDVKIQVEFNPALVQEYRLIGYESRILNAEDFNNDKVDAGDVGAGKTVTALYEIVPAGGENQTDVPDLKYSSTAASGNATDLCTVAIRFKDINSGKTGAESKLVEKAVLAEDYHEVPDGNTALAISLAEAGMVIRDSEYKGTATLTSAEAIARAAAADTENSLALSWADLLRTLIGQSE